MQTRPGLAELLAARADLSRERAQEIIDTLVRIDAEPQDPPAVADLIARAERHPLGLEFLLRGHVESVAITFGTHAFHVDEARRALAGPAAGPTAGPLAGPFGGPFAGPTAEPIAND